MFCILKRALLYLSDFLARTRLIFVLLLFLSLKCRTFTTGIRVENHEQHHERLYWNLKQRIGIVVCDY